MADSTRNVFDVLEEDVEDNAVSVILSADKSEPAEPASGTSQIVDGVSNDAAESQSWTDVSRTRRLVPKYSLSKEVMGLEGTRSRGSAPPTPNAPTSGTDVKKKVIRFSREEILSLRRPSKPLPELTSLGDIFFPGQQDPECFKKLDADEVHRLWHATPDIRSRGGGDAGRGRGRGRGKEDQNANDWSRGAVTKGQDNWDDSGMGGKGDDGLDLADFSAATLKFRTEMGDLGKDDKIELYDSNDVMERLCREQRVIERMNEVTDDERIPEWADVDVLGSSSEGTFFRSEPETAETTNAGGRAILNALLPSAPITSSSLQDKNTDLDYILGVQSLDVSSRKDKSLSQLSHEGSDVHSPISRGAPAAVIGGSIAPLHLLSMEDALWMYLDPRNRPQGPFSTSSMRQWMVDGYFAPTLPIKLTHWSDFYPLYSVYQDAMSAFQVVPIEPTTGLINTPVLQSSILLPATEASNTDASINPDFSDSKEKSSSNLKLDSNQTKAPHQGNAVAVEAKKKEKTTKVVKTEILVGESKDAAESKKKKEAKAPWGKSENADGSSMSIADIQAEEKKMQAVSANKSDNEQNKTKSSQLKSLLGLPPSPQKETTAVKEISAVQSWGAAPAGSRAPANRKSLKEIQEEEERVRMQREAIEKEHAAASLALSVQAAPKWKVGSSGPNVVQPINSPSLSEIMQQEEKARQGSDSSLSSLSRNSGRSAATSWAAKASKLSSGGSYNALAVSPVTKEPSAEVSKSDSEKYVKPSSNPQKVGQIESFWNFSDPVESKTAKPVSASNQGATGSKKTSDKSDFGGHGMPAAMSDWCTSQLDKMKKNTDLTLIQFCYTLQSPVEIREYFAEYLGSTPQVSQFATEFIQRKEGKTGASSGGLAAPITALSAGTQTAPKKKKSKTPK